jgi:ubiquinol-cytochrome c reductase cytochrome c subunit
MRRARSPLPLRSRAVVVLATTLVLLAAAASATAAQPDAVTRGAHLYGQYCLACHAISPHGETGPTSSIGAGPLRAQEVQQAVAPSLRGVGALAADFYLRTGYMPLAKIGDQPHRARVLLGEGAIRDLVAYVAALGSGPAIPAPHPARGSLSTGMQLFTDHCAGCHQIAGVGGYVTGAVAPPLSDASAVQIAEAVRIGPYVMPRFSERAISNRQLDSIVAYVEYTRHPDDRGGWAIGRLGPIPEGLVTWFIAAVALIAICVVIGKRIPREG